MPAITWHTVLGESLANVARPFELARQSFNDGFGALNRVLDSRNAGAAEMGKQTQDTNEQSYLNTVGDAQTPEDVAALQPKLAAMRSILSPAAQGRVRNADELRQTEVIKQATDRLNYAHTQQDEREHPLIQQAIALAASGDRAGFEAFAAANPGLRNYGDVISKGVAALQGNEENARKAGKYESDLQTAESTREHNRIAGEAALRQAAAAEARANNDGKYQRGMLGYQKLEYDRNKAAALAAQKLGIGDGGYMDTAAGFKSFDDEMAKLKVTPSARTDIMYNMDKHFRDGINIGTKEKPEYVPVPVSLAVKALNQSEENWLANAVPGWSRRGDDFSNVLKSYLSSPQIIEQLRSARKLDLSRTAKVALTIPTPPGKGGKSGAVKVDPTDIDAMESWMTPPNGDPNQDADPDYDPKRRLR